ncbi:MAG TPA: hypothetical protein VMS71_02060, partial [Candidatus Acidoferrum sp.]|nr:hypothetical protein [Candidatus Acidoferrum sp.]
MFTVHKGTLVALGVILVLILGATTTLAAKYGKVSDEEWKMGPPSDYSQANAMVILDCESLYVSIQGRGAGITMERHVRYKVFNKDGASEIGN